jgi:hypothetical protein
MAYGFGSQRWWTVGSPNSSSALPVPRTALGHEHMRKELERLVAETDCHSIAKATGYQELTLPPDSPLTWWAHLVLIYYKRLYCNLTHPAL